MQQSQTIIFSRVVQEVVLEFTPLCNDQGTYPAVVKSAHAVCLLRTYTLYTGQHTQHGNFNPPFIKDTLY
jgi:hypothetical protein